MATMHFIAAIGGQYRDARVAQLAREVPEQLKACFVRPVQILEHEKHGRFARERAEEVLEGDRKSMPLDACGCLRAAEPAELREKLRQIGGAALQNAAELVTVQAAKP